MAIQSYPMGNQSYFNFIRFFRPVRSQSVVFVRDMGSGKLLRLLRWGSEIYVPVYEGMQLGIGVYNGNAQMTAYPTYVEGLNLWEGGHHEPELCSPNHMWELRPGQTMTFDKLMTPYGQLGRPLIIQQSGRGMTVGEASFGTNAYRGQVRVYERSLRLSPQNLWELDQSQIFAMGDEELNPEAIAKDLSREALLGGAGIGAGAEVHQGHHDTGQSYSINAKPVVFLRMEYREDLEPLLNQAWSKELWSWDEYYPNQAKWWEQQWDWRSRRTIMPEIPVARPQPHRPR